MYRILCVRTDAWLILLPIFSFLSKNSIFLFLFHVFCFWFSVGILSISTILNLEDNDDENDEKDENNNGSNYEKNIDDNDVDENDFDRNYIDGVIDCKWFPNVDFVIENGPRGLIVDEITEKSKSGRKRVSLLGGLSTIVDLTTGCPVILRQGKGLLDVNSIQT